MRLNEGAKGSRLKVLHMDLPVQRERRREGMGMREGPVISVVTRKKRGVMITKIRGTRFAIGEQITKNIEGEPV